MENNDRLIYVAVSRELAESQLDWSDDLVRFRFQPQADPTKPWDLVFHRVATAVGPGPV